MLATSLYPLITKQNCPSNMVLFEGDSIEDALITADRLKRTKMANGQYPQALLWTNAPALKEDISATLETFRLKAIGTMTSSPWSVPISEPSGKKPPEQMRYSFISASINGRLCPPRPSTRKAHIKYDPQ
jgi:hypothetical protein